MTANIKFEGYKPTKPSSLKWKRSIDNNCDSATIVVPAMCRMIDRDKCYSIVQTGLQIKEGTKVEIKCGYDGKNDRQFLGFVSRINFKVPVEIECEGYSYQLRRKMINHRFGKTTVREVLKVITAGTDIRLSNKMPEKIEFEPMRFQNYTALQVLDFLKEKYLLTVFFEFDELYVGWKATYKGDTVKHRLNWNVIKDDSLLFNTYTGAVVHIEMVSRAVTGIKHKTKAHLKNLKPGDVKRVHTFIQSHTDKQMAADDQQALENKKGYSGRLTAFLKPHVVPGMTSEIIDKKYAERNGRYFIDGVEGSFSTVGGRQIIDIGFALKDNG